MDGGLPIQRTLILYVLVLPLAMFLGYTLAEPLETGTLAVLVMIAALVGLPVILRFHHPVLVFCWHLAINPFFLPGRPYLWMLVAGVGFVVAVCGLSTDARRRFLPSAGVSGALIALGTVVVLTALITGGFNTATLSGGGGNFGGKGYFYILAAICGFFVLTSRAVPRERAWIYVSLFFLSGVTAVISNLAPMLGPQGDFLLDLFPVENALSQYMALSVESLGIAQFGGLAMAGLALQCWLLAAYGLRGTFNLRHPWRAPLFLAGLAAGILSGFRTYVVLMVVLMVVQFFLEGLHRTRWLGIVGAGGVLGFVLLVGLADRLPLPAQKAISFLPVEIHPAARTLATHSTEWRIDMWKLVLPEVPQYLLRGRGYRMAPSDMLLMQESILRGYAKPFEWALISGDYHNGPLSVIIPFGLWGALAFLWFVGASLRLLYRNFRHSPPELKVINTALLTVFVTRAVIFFTIYGALFTDLFLFTGLVGLSISLNGGARAPAPAPEPAWRTPAVIHGWPRGRQLLGARHG